MVSSSRTNAIVLITVGGRIGIFWVVIGIIDRWKIGLRLSYAPKNFPWYCSFSVYGSNKMRVSFLCTYQHLKILLISGVFIYVLCVSGVMVHAASGNQEMDTYTACFLPLGAMHKTNAFVFLSHCILCSISLSWLCSI